MKPRRSRLFAGWPAPSAGARTNSAGPEAAGSPRALRPRGRSGDVLGLAWVHGALHAAAFRRQSVAAAWSAATPVHTLAEFATALDDALAALAFSGTDAFLVLAHEQFAHQTETAPAFSDKAARTYLRARIERLEQEREPFLWVSQRAHATKKEAAHVLHLLPVTFYSQLNGILVARRLDLTRILPLHVPLQAALTALTQSRRTPALIAAEAGGATAVLAGGEGGEVLFSRTILESWRHDAARVAVEINRSLLYAKQRFGAAVECVRLLGEGAEPACAEVAAKCGTGTIVTTEPASPLAWLQATCRVSPRHPINLVAPFMRRKRRHRFGRRVLTAACWLGLGWMAADAWNAAEVARTESVRLAELAATRPQLAAELQQLAVRNADFARQRAFVDAVVGERQPPVAEKFLTYLAAILPREARLSTVNVKWNEATARWEFEVSGTIDADADTAAAMMAAVRRSLARSPLRAHFATTVRGPAALALGPGLLAQPFNLEGDLFAN